MIMFATIAGGNSHGAGFSPPSGWTELLDFLGPSQNTVQQVVWWRKASSEPGSYTITSVQSNVAIISSILAYTSVVPNNPIQGLDLSVYYSPYRGTFTSPFPAPIFPRANDVALISYAWMDATGGSALPTFTTPSTWTSRVSTSILSSNGYSPGLQVIEKLAGSDRPIVASDPAAGVWSVASVSLSGSSSTSSMLPFFQ
jgi:hypothetical protein